jgi:hypothetical protein
LGSNCEVIECAERNTNLFSEKRYPQCQAVVPQSTSASSWPRMAPLPFACFAVPIFFVPSNRAARTQGTQASRNAAKFILR